MRVGILGSGLMGAKIGTLCARAGHDVTFSYARSTDKLARLVREAGGNARFGTPAEAAAGRTRCCWQCTGTGWATSCGRRATSREKPFSPARCQ